jgi:hypothetical protein
MKRWEAWWNHAALAAVSLTGLVYGVFKYFVPNSDPDSRAGHPLQPVFLKAHLLAAPFALIGVGLLLHRHALSRMRLGERQGRRTGGLILWLVVPVALSGVLIQVLVEPHAVRWTGWTHAALGALFVIGYALHPKRRSPAPVLQVAADDGVTEPVPEDSD